MPKIHSHCFYAFFLAGRICNCSTPKNAQTGNPADAALGARESPEQLGYHSENDRPCGRVRFKNEGSCGPKVESVSPRTSPLVRPFIFLNCSSPMPFFLRSYSGQTSMLLKAKWKNPTGKMVGLRK